MKEGDVEEKEMKIENLDEGNSEEPEFPKSVYRETVKPDQRSEFDLKIETVQILNTKFGQRFLLCGGGQCIFGNKLLFTKLASYGITKPSQLIGKTLHLKSAEIYVRGIPKKMWKLEGVE
jgi:hypothetical protein